MEILTTSFSFFLLLILIVSPLFIINRLDKLKLKNNFLLYLILGIIVTSLLTFLIGWWSDFSNKILLSHYGYDFEAMKDVERYKNVTKENLEKVKGLVVSMMGIGWPLKAIMTYVIYCPYLLLVYVVSYFYKKNKIKKEQVFLSEN